uniref:Uncharacterized protein n=1 Tax=Strongyloides stercoralis TaxID=6248 RepID=A0A0K0EAG0_STRER
MKGGNIFLTILLIIFVINLSNEIFVTHKLGCFRRICKIPNLEKYQKIKIRNELYFGGGAQHSLIKINKFIKSGVHEVTKRKIIKLLGLRRCSYPIKIYIIE